jgi:hypothetical protein
MLIASFVLQNNYLHSESSDTSLLMAANIQSLLIANVDSAARFELSDSIFQPNFVVRGSEHSLNIVS